MSVLSERIKASRAATAGSQGPNPPQPSQQQPIQPQAPTARLSPTPAPSPVRVPGTKTGTTWFSIGAAAFVSVILVVFMLQNTGNVDVSFLWMTGQLPLGLALLIAGIGVAIVAGTVGAARMTRLRRLIRTRRH